MADEAKRNLLARLDLPPVWTAGAWVLAWALARLAPSPGWESLGLRWLGLLWIALAFLMALWAALTLRRHRTPIEPGQRPKSLVTRGPYAWSRNPIYLAMVIATLGWGLWLGAAAALLPAVLLLVLLDRRFAAPEEARLRETFGRSAEDYIARVRRWA